MDKTRRNAGNLQNGVLLGMIPFQSKSEWQNSKIETILDRTGDHPHVEIQIKRKETAVQRSIANEMKALNKPITKNIITVFLDTMSRAHFMRKMKKTFAWMEQYYNNSKSPREAYQFFRFHSLGQTTEQNIMAVYFGRTFMFQVAESIFEHFDNQGYITAMARDFCISLPFLYTEKQLGHHLWPYDHELLALFCDPNYHPKQYTGFFTGPYSAFRRCLYGKDTFEYVLEYGEKFWKTYPDRPKVLNMEFNDGHESTGEVVGYMDEPLEQFFINLDRQGLLNDTTILFYSDHGQHAHLITYLTDDVTMLLELKLPIFLILLPREAADTYGSKLKEKEQKLVGPHDIHDFLEGLSGSKDYSKGMSDLHGPFIPRLGIDLLFEDIPDKRNCWDAHVKYDCACF